MVFLLYFCEVIKKETMIEDVVKYVKEVIGADDERIEIVDSGALMAMSRGEKVTPREDLTWEGVPVLFGKEGMETHDGRIKINADLIASAAYVLGRGDELFGDCERDEHGRQIGKKSLLGRLGWTERPLVDEYRRILNHLTNKTNNENDFKVILTHDVDVLRRGGRIATFMSLMDVRKSKHWTFDWMRRLSEPLRLKMKEKCEEIVFVKASYGLKQAKEDEPTYNLNGKDFCVLKNWCRKEGVRVGLHGSYLSGQETESLIEEKKRLEEALCEKVTMQRNHFLRQLSPANLVALEKIGFEDDYTTGWADCVGFKIGTCRAVRRLDLVTMEVGSLRTHPLSIMDCTLTDEKYMGLTAEPAKDKAIEIAKVVKRYGGELILLWHNHTVGKGEAHREIYKRIVESLVKDV